MVVPNLFYSCLSTQRVHHNEVHICPSFFFCVGRHCLWIVGNGTTLSSSNSVWQKIIKDVQDRGCFFDVNDDKDLSNAIVKAIIEQDDAENSVKMESLHISRARFQVFKLSS